MHIANGVFFAVFLLSAAVQLNDPDPWIWIGYYLVAAAFTLFAMTGRYTAWAGLAAAAYVAGFVYYTPGWDLDTVLLLREPKMESKPGVEQAREGFGLLICAGWTGVIAFTALRRRKLQNAAPDAQPGSTETETRE